MSKFDKIIIFSAIILALIFICTGFYFTDIPLRDVANRYAPMTEAFASGNFKFAFHPNFQPLTTIVAGGVAFITGVDGFTALKIGSAIWYFAGMFLLYHLVRLIYPEQRKIAVFSLLLYAIFPTLLHMAFAGLRESAKTFLLLLSAVSLLRIYLAPDKKINYFLLGIASGLSVIAKSDLTITGIFILFAGVFIECRHRMKPQYSLIAFVPFFLLAFPHVCLNYRLFGVAVPDARYAAIWQNLTGKLPTLPDFITAAAVLSAAVCGAAFIASWALKRIKARHIFSALGVVFAVSVIYTALSLKSSSEEIYDYINSFFEGFYDFLGLFVLFYLVVRSSFRKLEHSWIVVLSVICANALCNILPILLYERKLFISSRYLHPALPLLFGFFIFGINDVYRLIMKYIGRKYAFPLLVCVSVAIAGGMIFHTFQPTIRDHTRKRNIRQRQKVFELVKTIKDDYRGKRYMDMEPNRHYYVSQLRPKLYFIDDNKISTAAYLSGGSIAWIAGNADYIVSPYLPDDVPEKLILLGKIRGYRQVFNVWRVEK